VSGAAAWSAADGASTPLTAQGAVSVRWAPRLLPSAEKSVIADVM
jgi:hypothetical protein